MNVADFETTTNPEDCRVWAWSVCDIDTLELTDGTSIETFMNFIARKGGVYYFHNLKFDGEFIVSFLLSNGWRVNPDGKNLRAREFFPLISDMGQWYTVKIQFPTRKVELRDSLKLITMPVDAIPKAFNLDCKKLSIDYKEDRPKGHVLTQEEKDYVHNDVLIVAQALKILFKQGMNKLTQGSNAVAKCKEMIGAERHDRWFPAS